LILNDSTGSPVININNIKKSFGIFKKKEILKGINLEVEEGKCVVLMGENGAGKTTLLKIICGLSSHDCGKIYTKGKISYLPEVFSIYPYLTARESLDLFSNFWNVMYDTDLLLDMLKLPKDSKTLSKDYSKGTKRKTSMGMVMTTESDIFIMDEPFEGLDPKICNDIVQIILNLKKKSKSFLIATHDLVYSDIIADEIVTLHNGVIQKDSLKLDRMEIIIKFVASKEMVSSFLKKEGFEFDLSFFPEVKVQLKEDRSILIKELIENHIDFEEVRNVHLKDKMRGI
jgi:ABC-type multidrug transport system ATPase subunit